MDEDSSTKWETKRKTRQAYSSGAKKNVLRFDLKESRESFWRRERGKSFHTERPKTEKERELTVESLGRGIWRLRVLEAERRKWEGMQS